MNRKNAILSSFGLLGLALAGFVLASGCAGPGAKPISGLAESLWPPLGIGSRCCKPAPPCYGFQPTCWHGWPEWCAACPMPERGLPRPVAERSHGAGDIGPSPGEVLPTPSEAPEGVLPREPAPMPPDAGGVK